MKNLILLKLGGSIITNKKKDFTIREDNILRLVREIKKSLKVRNCPIIIGHGAGSFAHIPAHKYKTKEGLVNKSSIFGMAVTEDAAKKLNMIVVKNFLETGLPAFSFSPASFLISDAKVSSKSYFDPIKKALQIGVIPVVYGDVIIDKKIGCTIFSTEKILSILARQFLKDYKIRVIYCTNTDGVYDKEGKTISKITPENFGKVKKEILGAATTDVTGGMLHKVEESLKLAKETGIETLIIDGVKKGNLTSALLGKKTFGTLISANKQG